MRRAQFFLCVQKSDEPVQAYLLRLKELYCTLRQHDADEAPTDSYLKDQFLLGLEGGPLLQALKMFARHNPDATFAQIQQEAFLLEGEQQGTKCPEVVCAAVGGSNYPRSRSQTDWKHELKKEIMEEMRDQLTDWKHDLIKELKSWATGPSQSNQPTYPEAYAQPQFKPKRSRTCNPHRWDENGRPICGQCKASGHIARFCKNSSESTSGLN